MTNSATLTNPKTIDFPWIDKAVAQYESQSSILRPLKVLFHHAAHALFTRRKAVVHYISDNGNYADTARGEIVTRLRDASAIISGLTSRPAIKPEYHDIPSQDTHAGAFDLAQLARGAVRGFGNVFFMNCAPRKKQRGIKKGNGGESVYAGILPNGAIIAGTGEDAFTHFKDLVKAGQLNIYKTNVATDGTQFRSRDYFPWFSIVVGNHINRPAINRQWKPGLDIEQRDKILFGLNVVDPSAKLKLEDIPDIANDGALVLRADTHKNLKLGIRYDQLERALKDTPQVVVYANGHVVHAELATDSFDKQPGRTALSGGSSGRWTGTDGQKLPPFSEIFTVGGRAQKTLAIQNQHLKDGVEVHIIPQNLFKNARDELAIAEGRIRTEREVAGAIVQAGLVKGLNWAPLQQSLAENSFVTKVEPYLPIHLPATARRPSQKRKPINSAEATTTAPLDGVG